MDIQGQLIDEIVTSLTEDENVLRIKRLMLFICHDYWSNDVEEVKRTDLRQLVEDTLRTFPILAELKQTINLYLKRINKQSDYLLAADTIIDTIGLLYAEMPVIPVLPADPQFSTIAEPLTPITQKLGYIPNPFDVRGDICRNISPLHAKILIFSVLEYPFDPMERDWSALCTCDLDGLLERLFLSCETSAELKVRLFDTAKTLPYAEDARRAAGVILQALEPFFAWPVAS
ncbi:MAG: hypothetical protein HC919_00930 [Oscillatoriales cyanobacterium SM2_2_1]|nr:hypothetical protein [Oscillatoriales cyanobacterium SM2_2_1]